MAKAPSFARSTMTLDRSQAKRFYDRFGERQDAQGFYEDPALDRLIEDGDFASASSVFEFGCGTGKLARRLLLERLRPEARYFGIDISTTMIAIAGGRLAEFGERARVALSDGSIRFPLGDSSVDRVVSTYVLDLLPATDIAAALAEAHRVLKPGGLLCLSGLGTGDSLPSRALAKVWNAVFRLSPTLVGGCRPMHMAALLREDRWAPCSAAQVVAWAIPSEVVIARALHANAGPGMSRSRNRPPA